MELDKRVADPLSPEQGFITQGKVRTDGEHLAKDRKTKYAIEIDTGSERKESLILKMENYGRLFDA